MNVHIETVTPEFDSGYKHSPISVFLADFDRAHDALEAAESDTDEYEKCLDAINTAEKALLDYRCCDLAELQHKVTVLIRMFTGLGDIEGNLGCVGLDILQSMIPPGSVPITPQWRIDTIFSITRDSKDSAYKLSRQTYDMDDATFSAWAENQLAKRRCAK